ncbi:hypothetical protein RHSIM_Rhsim03G0118000 [Rhododendron simsii]|uniref:Uncharacterized protein n=1 Tax=Rhododendron simsii TaxID=118357 RepID=A0A834LQS0_RHOSS|nr:hypothetical protein RHSIM_Rhsim03G0118000 [Rhododendron simsii]
MPAPSAKKPPRKKPPSSKNSTSRPPPPPSPLQPLLTPPTPLRPTTYLEGDVPEDGEVSRAASKVVADGGAQGPDGAHARPGMVCAVIKKMAFLIVRVHLGRRDSPCSAYVVSIRMVKFATGLSKESYVDVEGIVSGPNSPIEGASRQPIFVLQVEIQVRKVYCVSKVVPTLPINNEDAARSEVEIDKALQFLLSGGFVGIHTTKLIVGSNEGGSAVFRLDYKGQPACQVQSPQLHNQMAICGLDVEMEIKELYSKVIELLAYECKDPQLTKDISFRGRHGYRIWTGKARKLAPHLETNDVLSFVFLLFSRIFWERFHVTKQGDME